jgi:hypothetical protein
MSIYITFCNSIKHFMIHDSVVENRDIIQTQGRADVMKCRGSLSAIVELRNISFFLDICCWHNICGPVCPGLFYLHPLNYSNRLLKNLDSVAWVRERTIPIERPPLVGEVSANFCGYSMPRGEREGSLRPYSRISRPELLLFLSSSSSVVLTRLSGPRSKPITSHKNW